MGRRDPSGRQTPGSVVSMAERECETLRHREQASRNTEEKPILDHLLVEHLVEQTGLGALDVHDEPCSRACRCQSDGREAAACDPRCCFNEQEPIAGEVSRPGRSGKSLVLCVYSDWLPIGLAAGTRRGCIRQYLSRPSGLHEHSSRIRDRRSRPSEAAVPELADRQDLERSNVPRLRLTSRGRRWGGQCQDGKRRETRSSEQESNHAPPPSGS